MYITLPTVPPCFSSRHIYKIGGASVLKLLLGLHKDEEIISRIVNALKAAQSSE
jgi:hypothetical protein